jgi:hypothetical protein
MRNRQLQFQFIVISQRTFAQTVAQKLWLLSVFDFAGQLLTVNYQSCGKLFLFI